MARIEEVIPKEDYIIKVLLDNGSSVSLNMKSMINTIRFGMLSDMDFFMKAKTDGNQVLWGYAIEISVNEFFQLAQK